MVLPDRIELSTSPLPMECSTTELRQHAWESQNRPKRAPQGGRSLPQGQGARKRGVTATMKDDADKSSRPAGKPAKNQREARLKLALRENLKRRKSQAKERGDFTPVPSGSDEPGCDGGDENPGK